MTKARATSLQIHSELQHLLPALSESEYAGLEAGILKNGCLSPLIVWNDVVVDGHHRYTICQKHGLPFETKNMSFDSIDAAKLWAWQHQEHRRNLSLYQRGEIALQFKPMIATKAKQRQQASGGDRRSEQAKSVTATSPEPVEAKETRQELADIAGVGSRTMDKVEYLSKHADDSAKQKLRKGDTTINAEYKRLKTEMNRQEREEKKQAEIVIPQDDRICLHVAPVAEASQYMEAESVDYIISDPPYPR
ncbi:MAG: hypothetical protein FWD31_13425, partial [Planctomycetaceae bacterium]|nr:hypothetical protein [Planctomycetaceae bacterium]